MWVLGSDSHYTILYSLDRRVQEESARDKREKGVREAFDAFDRSGGGGFIDRSSVQEFLARARCPPEVTKALEGQDLVTWHEAWAAVAAARSRHNDSDSAQLLAIVLHQPCSGVTTLYMHSHMDLPSQFHSYGGGCALLFNSWMEICRCRVATGPAAL